MPCQVYNSMQAIGQRRATASLNNDKHDCDDQKLEIEKREVAASLEELAKELARRLPLQVY